MTPQEHLTELRSIHVRYIRIREAVQPLLLQDAEPVTLLAVQDVLDHIDTRIIQCLNTTRGVQHAIDTETARERIAVENGRRRGIEAIYPQTRDFDDVPAWVST